MAKRRTKSEKIAASWRRRFEAVQNSKQNTSPQTTVKSDVPEVKKRDDFYTPEFSLSLNLLRRDLTKSLAVTILALILQFSLAAYLNQGGWQTVHSMLQKLTVNN